MQIGKSVSGPLTVVLIAVASLVSPVAAMQSLPTAATARISIDNFGRVNDAYFRGAQPVGADYASLAALGIKTVINLTSDDADAGEQLMVERAGMTYLQIPMTTRIPPTETQLASFLNAVNDPAMQPVYVHCVGGRHRTGVMTAAYRMSHDGWDASKAFTEMKQFKFGADFLHPEFKAFVYAYKPDVIAPPASELATITVSH